MPVRRNMVRRLTERVVGVHVWNGLIGEPVTITRADWDRAADAADELYDQVVRGIDWNRILIEAQGRHLQLDHPSGRPCGECVREALLYDERGLGLSALHPWEKQPTVPERDAHPDWAAAFAELVRCRQAPGGEGAPALPVAADDAEATLERVRAVAARWDKEFDGYSGGGAMLDEILAALNGKDSE